MFLLIFIDILDFNKGNIDIYIFRISLKEDNCQELTYHCYGFHYQRAFLENFDT